MKKIFSVKKTEDFICLYNLNGIYNLKIGAIFFKRYKDGTTATLYESLDKEYMNSIVDNLSETEKYDFDFLNRKKIKKINIINKIIYYLSNLHSKIVIKFSFSIMRGFLINKK